MQQLRGLQKAEDYLGLDFPSINATWIFTLTEKSFSKEKLHFPTAICKVCIVSQNISRETSSRNCIVSYKLESWRQFDQRKHFPKHESMPLQS